MNTDDIIDNCLLAIGETDTSSPSEMSRAQCLSHINHAYQDIIGPYLSYYKLANPTSTGGVVTVPSDFLSHEKIWDGTPDDGKELTRIFDIADKVDDDDDCQQYMFASENTIWLFGTTPSTTLYMYYRAKPDSLVDSSTSSPSLLKARYHYDAFTTYVKMIRAKERNDLSDYYVLKAEWLDILDEISRIQSGGGEDDGVIQVQESW